MHWLRSAVCILAFAASPALHAQGELGSVDDLKLSPYDLDRIVAGQMAPDFRLQDQDGKVHQLSHYRDKNVVLVMYGGWWGGANARQIGQLKHLLDDRLKQTTQILALSPSDMADAMKMVELQKRDQGGPPNFPLLADPDHSVIDRYGHLNRERAKRPSSPDPAGYIVPYPAVFVIDRQGRVAWKYTDATARNRPSNEQILEALAALDGGGGGSRTPVRKGP